MFFKNVFLLLVCISTFFNLQLYSQERDGDKVNYSKNNDLDADSLHKASNMVPGPSISPFIEILGKGSVSLNVDFRKKATYAISIGIQPLEGLLPNVMYYHFCGNRRRFEIGGGISGGFSKEIKLDVVLIHGVIGYRFQKKKGLFFRAGITPFYVIFLTDKERSNKFYPFAGLSLGYSF
jgi:hypothetical protein